ncbi:MAG: diacylglycerol kinase [Elusimicrobia bacterium]|nr:diacylglycerol kinase [Elusimicrobiota bacterium]
MDKPGKKKTNIVKSFDYALRGLVYAVKTQRNMRIHLITAVLVIIVSLFLNLSRTEMIAIIFAISLVLITEILNTSSELMVNLITDRHHPLAKIIKDMSAGAVLFSSICAILVGYMVFIKQEVLEVLERSIVIEKISSFPPYISAAIIFLVIVISLFIKSLKGENISIIGGMPSIHTAVAFSLASIAYLISGNIYVCLITALLAGLVGQARISAGVHNIWEVIAGALIGIFLTVIIFQTIAF